MNTRIDTKSNSLLSVATANILWVVGGAFFLALASLCRFELWISPVPVTAQTFAVLMLGAFLGSRKGPIAVLVYLAFSACHMPLFYGILGGATTGYLIGFVVAAFFVGSVMEMGAHKSMLYTFLSFIGSGAIILICGTLWLGSLIGFKQALAVGLYPFILVDVAKSLIATTICAARWKLKKS